MVEPTARQPPVGVGGSQGQPKLLVHMLKEFAKRKTLVQFKRPYLGNQRYAARWPLCLTLLNSWMCSVGLSSDARANRVHAPLGTLCARHARARHGAIFYKHLQKQPLGHRGVGIRKWVHRGGCFGASRIVFHVLMAFHLNAMIDAPCGAMAWQTPLLNHLVHTKPGFRYLGIDVVKHVVQKN